MALRLSNELLIKTFVMLRDNQDDRTFGLDRKKWLLVTHVCRLWRDTALASPVLWSSVRVWGRRSQDVQFARMCLQRAHSAPVDILVEGEGTAPVVAGIIALAQEHSKHVRCLKLMVEETEEQVFRLGFPMPMLQTLELRAARDIASESSVGQDFVPDPIHLPRLRELALENVNNPWEWNSSIFAPLTSFELSGYCYDAEPTETQFIGVLSALRNVATLTLVRSVCDWSRTSGEDLATVVSLPALRHLTVLHWPSHIQAVINTLEIPIQAAIHLTFCQLADNSDECVLVEHVSKKILSRGTVTSTEDGSDSMELSCCAMSLSTSADWTMELQCRTSCLLQDTPEPLPLRVTFAQWDEENDPVPTAEVMLMHLNAFCSAVASYGFECLHYAGSSMCDGDNIISQFLPCFHDIQLLEIEVADHTAFECAMDIQECYDRGCTPQLRRLIFTDLVGTQCDFAEPLEESVASMSLESIVVQTNADQVLRDDLAERLQDDVDDVQVVCLSDAEVNKRILQCQHFGVDVPWHA
ncbi:hypothetical protein CERSUDRAFT_99083 [Gelatoporia subvermispora B]|uniref:F-box domain-containing protein n=1 Tax=Ceriporiopsis subvermispora (strain B) TaxID=914234 RepID=M2R1D9_CERS8|nr:hypothetical protein CERSUDRAFT_99083 [Gelatoporia subvermispora B]